MIAGLKKLAEAFKKCVADTLIAAATRPDSSDYSDSLTAIFYNADFALSPDQPQPDIVEPCITALKSRCDIYEQFCPWEYSFDDHNFKYIEP